jgi:hypothetical protein
VLKKFKKTINPLPRFFLVLLLIAISLQAASLLFLIGTPNIAQASKPIEMNLQVPIPGLNSHIVFEPNTGKIAEYIKAIYNYAIGIVGILAAVVMMIGGLMWITAGGNTSNIGEAKAMITASLTGLVLVLTSYLLLSMVNPALVNLQSSVIGQVGPVERAAGTCKWKVAACAAGETDLILPYPKGRIDQGAKDCGPDPKIYDSDGNYEEASHCCCMAVTGGQFTCSDGKCGQVDSYIISSAKTYGVDPNILKAVIIGGEGCSANISSAGACGYGQEMPSIRKWCGAEGTDEQTCKIFQDDPQFSIDCAAALITTGMASNCVSNINNIARCYNTGKTITCGENNYCLRVENYFNSCNQ